VDGARTSSSTNSTFSSVSSSASVAPTAAATASEARERGQGSASVHSIAHETTGGTVSAVPQQRASWRAMRKELAPSPGGLALPRWHHEDWPVRCESTHRMAGERPAAAVPAAAWQPATPAPPHTQHAAQPHQRTTAPTTPPVLHACLEEHAASPGHPGGRKRTRRRKETLWRRVRRKERAWEGGRAARCVAWSRGCAVHTTTQPRAHDSVLNIEVNTTSR
jgi:hypothetical protein